MNGLFNELRSLVPANGQSYDFTIKEVNDETNVSPAPIHTDVSQVGHQGFQWSFLVKLPV
ncbi:hypothetical protein FD61_02370 [Streptococcus macedonicus]|nr:hypothetical protein FD61_02370 [Streptococcus macedonicus]